MSDGIISKGPYFVNEIFIHRAVLSRLAAFLTKKICIKAVLHREYRLYADLFVVIL